MLHLLEALDRLGRIELAVDQIDQRLPVELYKLVEKSNSEVSARHASILRQEARTRRREHQEETGQGLSMSESAALCDLLDTLYTRFEAVAEGHRLVHDVVVRKQRGEASKGNSTGSFKGLWRLYQSEVCMLS